MSHRVKRMLDAVELALYQGLFASCAEEMGITLMRTAHSPNIKERLDHSCALFDGAGRLVAQAAHIPVHLGSMPGAVEAAARRGPFAPGDVVMLNDPYAGGTHLPDITLVSPVFLVLPSPWIEGEQSRAGRRRPAARAAARVMARSGSRAVAPDFFVASRAHHADVGGAAPGSMPIAREVYEEGLRVPPIFLARGGRLVEDVMRLVLANVRTPEERRADLLAQLGAHATGERRFGGAAALASAARALQDLAEKRVRAGLAALPRGVYRFEDALDDDGIGEAPVRIAVTLSLAGGRARLDFSRSSPQTLGPVNAVLAVTRAATYYAVRCALGEMPVNDGTFRPIDIVAPLGTVVNPRPPAAVGAGNVETSQRIVDVVLGALARALPRRMPAASSGTMNNLLIGGLDPRTRGPFAYYETLAGGHGAGPGWNGECAMQAHMTNTRNTPVEALEHDIPLRVIETGIRRGSGGRGRWRGGDGVVRTLELRAASRVTVISERRGRGPYGLAGGEAGKPGVNRVRLIPQALERRMPGKFTLDAPAGAVITIESPGGGGFGRAAKKGLAKKGQ